jgi:hypothetical protein
VREWRESIRLFDRLRARRDDKVARASGIVVKRLEERSRDERVLARGYRDWVEMTVRALSASERCFKNLHLFGWRLPMRFKPCEEGVCARTVDAEDPRLLPESDLRILCDLWCEGAVELFLELEGLGGELLLSLGRELDREDVLGTCWVFGALVASWSGLEYFGEFGVEEAPSDGRPGLDDDHATGEAWFLDDRRLRLSISSRTIAMISSAGSSIPPLFMIKLRSLSASWSQPKNCRMSMSVISKAVQFLKASKGTAVSKGNSS